jgi:hypothetical protein
MAFRLQEKEVQFHHQCERMNAAAKWWPILQVGDGVEAGGDDDG